MDFPLLRHTYLALKDYDFRTRLYLVSAFATPAAFGSVSSFVIGGGVIYSFITVFFSFIPFTNEKSIKIIFFFFVVYIFCQIISTLVNSSIQSDFADLISNIYFFSIPFFYSFIAKVDKEQVKKATVAGCVVSCLIAFLMAVFEFYGRDSRAEGLAGNPIVFGMMVGLASVIVLAAAFSSQSRQRTLLFVASAAGAVAMFLSGTKIMWVALFACLIIILLIYRNRLAFRLTKAKGAAVVCGALIFGGLVFNPIVGRLENFMNDMATLDVTDANAVSYRLAVWKVGIGAFLDKPVFGHGAGATKGIIEKGLDREIGKPLIFSHFHNGFLTALVEAGIFGALALYCAFLASASIAIRALRAAKTDIETFGSTLLLLTVTTYLVCGMVGILVGHDIIDAVLLLALVVGTYLAAGKDPGSAGQSATRNVGVS